MSLQKEYENKKPIAVYCESNFGGIEILDIIYGINDSIVYRYNFGEPQKIHKAQLIYGVNVTSFKTYKGYRVRLDDCMRV